MFVQNTTNSQREIKRVDTTAFNHQMNMSSTHNGEMNVSNSSRTGQLFILFCINTDEYTYRLFDYEYKD
jgi:hypothetical protein